MSDKKIKEVIKKEYLKCAVDPVYFLKKYAVIQHPLQGKVPFALYPFQEASLKDFKENKLYNARKLIKCIYSSTQLRLLRIGVYRATKCEWWNNT